MILRSPPRTIDTTLTTEISFIKAFISAFLLTITNPITIFSFLALFAGIGLGSTHHGTHHGTHDAVLMVFGIVSGSITWEFLLSLSIKGIFYKHMNHTMMRIINYISGSTIIAFAALTFRV